MESVLITHPVPTNQNYSCVFTSANLITGALRSPYHAKPTTLSHSLPSSIFLERYSALGFSQEALHCVSDFLVVDDEFFHAPNYFVPGARNDALK
jgi:hypothetical protein